jgi:hypothetical protein
MESQTELVRFNRPNENRVNNLCKLSNTVEKIRDLMH